MPILVNGEVIDDEAIRQEANALRPRYEEMVTDMDPVAREVQLRDWSRENVIERILFRQEAMKDSTPLDEEQLQPALEAVRAEQPEFTDETAIRKEAEARLRTERLAAKVNGMVKPPKPPEIADFYKKNKDRFMRPEMVRCSHIVKHVDENTDEAAAREAIGKMEEQLNAGGDFVELANQTSDCPGNGGFLGEVYPGQMVEEFEEVVFTLEPGQRSGIFRTVFGWHIALVHERIPKGHRPLSDVRDEIEEALLAEKRQRAVENYLDRLKGKAKIQNVKKTE